MYLLIVAYRNGSCSYFGPFPNEERAEEYALACACSSSYARHFVKPLTTPYNVVQSVQWKERSHNYDPH